MPRPQMQSDINTGRYIEHGEFKASGGCAERLREFHSRTLQRFLRVHDFNLAGQPLRHFNIRREGAGQGGAPAGVISTLPGMWLIFGRFHYRMEHKFLDLGWVDLDLGFSSIQFAKRPPVFGTPQITQSKSAKPRSDTRCSTL